jgi:phosphinothricin acetyltransferase
LVVEDEGVVVGFASVSKWSERPAYGRTVIASEYIRQDYRGQGIGKALLVALLEAAYAAGYHTVMGNVYAGNEVSRRMVESIGFRTVGLLKEVGYKFDEWLDVYLVQHMKL